MTPPASHSSVRSTSPDRRLSIDQLLAITLFSSEGPQWSPDGRSLVVVSSLNGAPNLWVIGLDDGVLTRLTDNLGPVDIYRTYRPRWSPDGTAIAYVSAASGNEEIWLYPLDGAEARQISRLGGLIEGYDWSPDGSTLAVASNRHGAFDIYLVELSSGRQTRVTRDGRNEVFPRFTPRGEILYVRLSDDCMEHEVVHVHAADDGVESRVVLRDTDFFDYHSGAQFGYPTVSPDGRTFLFRSHHSGWINLWLAPLDGDGAPRQIAAANADQSDAAWSPDGRSIAFVENHNGTLGLNVVAADGGSALKLVAPEMGVCLGPAWSPDGRTVSYLSGSPTRPLDVWVVDVETGARRQLTSSVFHGGVGQRLVEPEKIVYPSFDGLPIHAYLYRPPAEGAPRSSPGILWVHGGPTSQFYDTFQPQVQYFVQQGYTLLLPNVRGSSGYGRAFEDLNNRDWGGGDLKDAIAGAEFLRGLPEVDPDHIGITGTSYGGILSNAAVTFAPGVFQAAIPISGYADFLHMMQEQHLRHLRLLEYELGSLPEAEEVYRRCSPIFAVAQAATPCFVLHGAGKYPGSEASLNFARALEAHFKPFWYKAYRGETYYIMSRAAVREQLLDMRAFFDLYLKGIASSFPAGHERPLTRLSGVVR